MLQAASNLAEKYKVLYIGGEESAGQLKQRADRIGAGSADVHIFSETELGAVERCLRELNPDFVVVDSVQTLYSPEIARPGR
jgi:DNA repair protein RadA/Sms